MLALQTLPGMAEAPRRMVSMNICTEQLAMLLAAPGQHISVSYLAADPRSSAMREQARSLPVNHGQAEEIAFLANDLVLAGCYTTRVTVDMLDRLGMKVEIFEPEDSLADIAVNLRQMGRALGRSPEAETMIAAMEARLAALASAPDKRPETAIYYS